MPCYVHLLYGVVTVSWLALMMKKMGWREYAARRTGLTVGSRGELRQNLARAFTANSFARFWQIWNPLFGFYLQLWLYRPLQSVLPKTLALWLTFVGNGVLHDTVTMLVRQDVAFFFTPWFALMGAWVVIEKPLGWQIAANRQWLAVCYHFGLLLLTAGLAWQFKI